MRKKKDEDDEVEPKYIVHLENDPDAENPAEQACSWRIYAFGRDWPNHKSYDELMTPDGKIKSIGLRKKVSVGLAFPLSRFEHSLCDWSIMHTRSYCDEQWDLTRFAGFAVWEDKPGDIGAKTAEDRAKDCAAFLKEYTDWCNGNCYYARIELADGTDVDSCSAIGSDWLMEALREILPEDATEENTRIEGEASHGIDFDDIIRKPTKELSHA